MREGEGSSTNGVSSVLRGWRDPLMPWLQGKGMRLSSSQDLWARYAQGKPELAPGSSSAHPPTPPPVPAPRALGAAGLSTTHSSKAVSLSLDNFCSCNMARRGEKLLSVSGHRDGERANPSLPVQCQPVQQELYTLTEVGTAHKLCISICRNQLCNHPDQTHKLPVN